jgi:hypothetical protein
LFSLLPLALASHSLYSCSCMSRSSVFLGLDSFCLGIDPLGFHSLLG